MSAKRRRAGAQPVGQPSGQRLVLTVPAGLGPDRLASALAAADVAAVILAPGEPDQVAVAQGAGVAALVASQDGSWGGIGHADGIHASGTVADRLATLKARPDHLTVGAVAYDRHEAMMLGEAGADYVWFGPAGSPIVSFGPAGLPDAEPAAGAIDRDAPDAGTVLELATWWRTLFEVPAVIAGPAASVSQMAASGAEFVAVIDVFAQQDARAATASLQAALAAPSALA